MDDLSALEAIEALHARIKLLEERVRGLRASRRLLMTLLASREAAAQAEIERLRAENQALRRRRAELARLALRGVEPSI